MAKQTKHSWICACIVFTVFAAPLLGQSIFYVDIASGVDDSLHGSQSAPWKTVSFALSQVSGSAQDPKVIRVAAGVYPGSITMKPFVSLYGGYESVGWTRDNTTHLTTLDGGGTAKHVVIGANDSRIDGFTIRGGNANGKWREDEGGGVYCDGTSPVIANNVITDNQAKERGGGVFSSGSNTVITGNTISSNQVAGSSYEAGGGGVYSKGSHTTIIGNTITGNSSEKTGGGIYLSAQDTSTFFIADNKIMGNHAEWVSGFYMRLSRWDIKANLQFIGNTVVANKGIGFLADAETITIERNLFTDGFQADLSSNGAINVNANSGTISRNLFIGNGFIDITGTTITNNVILGNSFSSSRYHMLHLADVSLINNSIGLTAPDSAGCVWLGETNRPLTNNIFVSCQGNAVTEKASNDVNPLVQNNLFFNSSRADYLDKNGIAHTGALAINTSIPGATNNVSGDPLLPVLVTGTWSSDGVFSKTTYRTTLTDNAATLIPNSLAGKLLNPKTSQGRLFFIESNSETTITVLGNSSPTAPDIGITSSETYRVIDYHLPDGSAALDRGAINVTGVPIDDIDGEARPGADERIDIGADEAPSAYAPPKDTTAPMTKAKPQALATTTTFGVPWIGSDEDSGIAYVRLFWRKGNSGFFSQYGATFVVSPISFVASSGDGAYQFYTLGTDTQGNNELKSAPDGETVLVSSFGGGDIVYVNRNISGGRGDGSSWANAVKTVHDGLIFAVGFQVPQVWVAAGNYPESVTLRPGVALYGGFAGTETQITERNLAANVSILDGGGTAKHVVIGADNSRIDGFTIRGGNATGLRPDYNGGGIFCDNTSPVITNNVITENHANFQGGGIYSSGSNVMITNNTISMNQAIWRGNAPNTKVADNTRPLRQAIWSFTGGGGIFSIGPNAVIANNTISTNQTLYTGGGIFSAGDNAIITGNTISSNQTIRFAEYWGGGGIFSTDADIVIRGNTIVGNSSKFGGGGIFLEMKYFFNTQVTDNFIIGNHGGYAGGVYINDLNDYGPSDFNNKVGRDVFSDSFGGDTIQVIGNTFAHNYGGSITAIIPRIVFVNNIIADNSGRTTLFSNRYPENTVSLNLLIGNVCDNSSDPIFSASSARVTNNVILGNGLAGVGSPLFALHYASFINNTIGLSADPYSPECLLLGTTTLPLANNIFVKCSGYAIGEMTNTSSVKPTVLNNLFFASTIGDYLTQAGTTYRGAAAINTNVPGAANNLDGDPGLSVVATGTWKSDGVFSSTTYRTTLTASTATLKANTLVGKLLNPKNTQGRLFYIESNTVTTITVLGNASPSAIDIGATSGEVYEVIDYHLPDGSVALGHGSTTMTDLPADDIDGEPRPGTDGLVDIGADERASCGLQATVGGDQTICAHGTTTGLGGNGPGSGTGAWSVISGGQGIFTPNASDPNATFTHTKGNGPVTLRWTIAEANCISSADVTVTIKPLPTAEISVQNLVCTGSSGNVASAADAGAGATYRWTIQNGAITSANHLPTVTFSAGASGSVRLTLAVTNPAGCSVITSQSVPITRACHLLSVTLTGNGAGKAKSLPGGIDCPTTCSRVFPAGTTVALMPTADSGSHLTSFGGNCSGASSCVVIMDSAKKVSVEFSKNEPGSPRRFFHR